MIDSHVVLEWHEQTNKTDIHWKNAPSWLGVFPPLSLNKHHNVSTPLHWQLKKSGKSRDLMTNEVHDSKLLLYDTFTIQKSCCDIGMKLYTYNICKCDNCNILVAPVVTW